MRRRRVRYRVLLGNDRMRELRDTSVRGDLHHVTTVVRPWFKRGNLQPRTSVRSPRKIGLAPEVRGSASRPNHALACVVTRPEFQRIFFMPNLDPTSVLGSDGVIARRLPSYEHRDEQLAMARAVTAAIERPGHLLVEAGTGVGKSFAYLVPAIQAAVDAQEEGRRLDTHHRAPGATGRQGHPVSAVGDGRGVLGRSGQGPVQLHQPAAAGCGASAAVRPLC